MRISASTLLILLLCSAVESESRRWMAPMCTLTISWSLARHPRHHLPGLPSSLGRSPVVREVLLHAILEPSALGTRLQAMELTPEILDPALQEALVFTMHHDPALAVRLEAMAVLSRHPFDARVREALLATLREDEAVQMRLLALETLAGQEVDPSQLERVIREAGQESDPAVLMYAATLGEGL